MIFTLNANWIITTIITFIIYINNLGNLFLFINIIFILLTGFLTYLLSLVSIYQTSHNKYRI